MTIYVDDPMPVGGKFHNYCHLWADDQNSPVATEAFGIRLGLHPAWLRYSRGMVGDFWHFDISPRKRVEALKMGAEYIPLRQWIAARLAQKAVPDDQR